MGRVDLGRGENGRRRRKTVYGDTRQAVGSEVNRLLGRSSNGELLVTSTPTLKAWLDDWYATHRDDWRPSTKRVYRVAIDQWIVPTLGTLPLEKLKPTAIQRWINQATEAGARPRVVTAHVVLHSALAWAMTQRVLTFNAAALVRVPRPTRKTVTPLTVEQGRALLVAASGYRLGGMVLLSLSLGLRIGEVSGVTWADVDVEAKTLRVRQQLQAEKGGLVLAPLKTANSRRTLTLPTIAVDALKAQRVAQLQERLRAGSAWEHADDLVFTMPSGRPVHPSHVRVAVLGPILKAAGIGHVKYHTLRHTAATLLLADGAPLFDVSRVLGHGQISTTSDIYGHLVPDMTAGAAARMDGLLKTSGKA